MLSCSQLCWALLSFAQFNFDWSLWIVLGSKIVFCLEFFQVFVPKICLGDCLTPLYWSLLSNCLIYCWCMLGYEIYLKCVKILQCCTWKLLTCHINFYACAIFDLFNIFKKRQNSKQIIFAQLFFGFLKKCSKKCSHFFCFAPETCLAFRNQQGKNQF